MGSKCIRTFSVDLCNALRVVPRSMLTLDTPKICTVSEILLQLCHFADCILRTAKTDDQKGSNHLPALYRSWEQPLLISAGIEVSGSFRKGRRVFTLERARSALSALGLEASSLTRAEVFGLVGCDLTRESAWISHSVHAQQSQGLIKALLVRSTSNSL